MAPTCRLWHQGQVLRIRDACRGFERQPQFEVHENSICVTLPLFVETLPLSDSERKAYQEIVGRSLQMSELTELTGFGRMKAQTILRGLVDKGYASVSGTGRGRGALPGDRRERLLYFF